MLVSDCECFIFSSGLQVLIVIFARHQPHIAITMLPMQSYHGLDAGLASGSSFVVRAVDVPTVIMNTSFNPSNQHPHDVLFHNFPRAFSFTSSTKSLSAV
jgi:hypothetical protein